MSLLFVNTNRSVGTIHRNLYGQFAEHLGHCIYGGGGQSGWQFVCRCYRCAANVTYPGGLTRKSNTDSTIQD